MSKNEEKKLAKNIANFFGQMVFGFQKTIIRATHTEKIMKIVRAVLQISSLLGFGHARAAFGQTPFSRVWHIVVT